MRNNKSDIKNETLLVYGASLGAAFGAAFGAIFKSIGVAFGVSMGVVFGLVVALLFGEKIVRIFGNPSKTDSNGEGE